MPIKGSKKKLNIPYGRIVGAAALGTGLYFGYRTLQEWANFRTQVLCSRKNLSIIKTPIFEYTTVAGLPWATGNILGYRDEVFDPAQMANDLYLCMAGITSEYACANQYRKIIDKLTSNDLRCLHNEWLKLINPTESVYDWIKAEGTSSSIEQWEKAKVLEKFNLAGVGQRNMIQPPFKTPTLNCGGCRALSCGGCR